MCQSTVSCEGGVLYTCYGARIHKNPTTQMENLIQMDNPTHVEDSSSSDSCERASSSSSSSSDEDEDNVILASMAATQATLAAAKTVLLIEQGAEFVNNALG
jgi:hypothetical protein